MVLKFYKNSVAVCLRAKNKCLNGRIVHYNSGVTG